jgi:hypothetical protein
MDKSHSTEPLVQLSAKEQADHDRSVHDYPEIMFSPTEYVVIDVERSVMGLIQIWSLVTLAFLALMGITFLISVTAPNGLGADIAVIGLASALALIIAGLIATSVFRANFFIVTNERVFSHIQHSPFSQHTQNVELEHVEDCSYVQNSVWQTLFNFGSIRLSTVGDEQTYKFKFVTRPSEQFRIINSVVQQVDEGEATRFQR